MAAGSFVVGRTTTRRLARTALSLYVAVASACQGHCSPRSGASSADAGGRRPSVASRQELMIEGAGVRLFAVGLLPEEAKRSIVGVHGGPGMVTRHFAELGVLTDHGLAVWWYLQRGVAPSSPPPDGTSYDLRFLADDLAAVVAEATRTPGSVRDRGIVIVAFSWGAVPAVVAASRRNPAIAGLILVNPAPVSWKGLTSAWVRLAERADWERAVGDPDHPAVDNAWRGCEEVLAPSPAADAGHSSVPADAARSRLPACSEEVHEATYRANPNYDVSAAAQAIDVPVLVVRGEHDPYGGDGAMEESLRAPAVVRLAGCGHRVLGVPACQSPLFAAIDHWVDGLGAND